MNFYVPLPRGGENTLQQGDLLEAVPFIFVPSQGAKVTLRNNETATRDLLDGQDVEFVAARVLYNWAMVLTQTCNLQPAPDTGHSRYPIVVARVQPVEEVFSKSRFDTPKNVEISLKEFANESKVPHSLYLPSTHFANSEGVEQAFGRSVANLLSLQTFVPADLSALIGQARLRLSDPALQAVQARCAYCFGRLASPDDLFYSAEEWEARKT